MKSKMYSVQIKNSTACSQSVLKTIFCYLDLNMDYIKISSYTFVRVY